MARLVAAPERAAQTSGDLVKGDEKVGLPDDVRMVLMDGVPMVQMDGVPTVPLPADPMVDFGAALAALVVPTAAVPVAHPMPARGAAPVVPVVLRRNSDRAI